MLINSDVKKILGGGCEIKAIKYMDNTIWQKIEDVNPCDSSCQKVCLKGRQCGGCQWSSQCDRCQRLGQSCDRCQKSCMDAYQCKNGLDY